MKAEKAVSCSASGNGTLLAASITFAVSLVGALFLIEIVGLADPMRLAVAALPVLAFAWFIVEEVRLVRGLDELERRIQLEALAVAFPLTVLVVFALGMLERVGLAVPAFEHLRDVWALAFLPYALGLLLARRRYR